jgi:hypothetical protein
MSIGSLGCLLSREAEGGMRRGIHVSRKTSHMRQSRALDQAHARG